MILIAISNMRTETKIRKFQRKLTDFEKVFYDGTGVEVKDMEQFNEYYLLATMPKRLRQIEFCYQCPLYQDKVQANKRKTFQENK